MILSREGDHMCRLVFAAVTLITIHTLCKDLVAVEISTLAKASLVTPRSLDISARESPASGTSTIRPVQTCTSGRSSYDQAFVSALGERDCVTGTGKRHDIFDSRLPVRFRGQSE
jgi:hypothetical protein